MTIPHYKTICISTVALFLFSGCGIKPTPIPEENLTAIAIQDIQLIFESQEPLVGSLSIGEAMSRALKYNLESRVKRMEEALANESLDMAKMDMLPILAASAGYLDRNNLNASSSTSILTHNQSLEPSTSTDKARKNADMRFSWNILDFGVSYLQATQDSDRYLVTQRIRQDMMLKLLQQVRSAFWRAATMQSLSGKIKTIKIKVENSLAELQQVRQKKLRPPISTLTDIRNLFDMLQQLENMQNSVTAAQVELTSLINSPHSDKIVLALPESMELPSVIPGDVSSLELTALTNSSQYISEVYNARIELAESKKSLLRLLPGIDFSYSINYDSNSYIVNETWGEAGIQVTANLMRLLFIHKVSDYNEARENFALARRLAVNMAVITKLHLSWQQHQNNIHKLFYLEKLSSIDNEISRITRDAEQNKSLNTIVRIQNDLRSLRSAISHHLAYADAQDSFGIFLLSIGLDPVPDNYQEMSVDDLAEYLHNYYEQIHF